jgi:hypothetical protein
MILTVNGLEKEYMDGLFLIKGNVKMYFNARYNVPVDTMTYSNKAYPASTGAVTVNNGAEFSIDGGPWVTSGSISAGQSLQLRVQSSPNYLTPTNISISISTPYDTWTLTTVTEEQGFPYTLPFTLG